MFENIINEVRAELYEFKEESKQYKPLFQDILKELIKIKSSLARMEKEKK